MGKVEILLWPLEEWDTANESGLVKADSLVISKLDIIKDKETKI